MAKLKTAVRVNCKDLIIARTGHETTWPCVVTDNRKNPITDKVIRGYTRQGFRVIRRSPLDKGLAERNFGRLDGPPIRMKNLVRKLRRLLPGSLPRRGSKMRTAPVRLEIDTFRLNIDLVTESGTAISRPLVTVVIDAYSRLVLKVHVYASPDVTGGS